MLPMDSRGFFTFISQGGEGGGLGGGDEKVKGNAAGDDRGKNYRFIS